MTIFLEIILSAVHAFKMRKSRGNPQVDAEEGKAALTGPLSVQFRVSG